MNTRGVETRTIWAVLLMEASLALPIISLPAQGDRLPGLAGPLLLLVLLPLGFAAVSRLVELRDPSWRLPVAIGLALGTRAIVSSVSEPGLPGLALWLTHNLVPAVIGVGLWWRGGGLAVAELTAADVRTEFSVVGVSLLVVLALVRPFLLPDPALLGTSVGMFVVGGLLAVAWSRQDAATASAFRLGGFLAGATAAAPALLAVFVVSLLRPTLVGGLWSALSAVILLALTPIAWLLSWLASLFPRAAPTLAQPAPRPAPLPTPDPALLAQLQERESWMGMVIAVALVLAAAVAAILVTHMLLANWIHMPPRATLAPPTELTIDRTGTPRDDAHAFLGWLMRWLRGRLGFRAAPASFGAPAEVAAADAWTAYRRLLEWAAQRGLARRPAETTGELQARLDRFAPEAAPAVDLLTTTYESERYGAISPGQDRLRRLQAALRDLLGR